MKFTFLKIAPIALSVLIVFCASCSDRAKEPSQSNDETTANEVVIFTWPDYIDPEVVSQFTAETGINVRVETYESLTQMKAYVKSKPGHYDVVIADNFYVADLSHLNLISKLKKDAIPNLSNYKGAFLNQDFDRGNEYSVPYLWGSVLMAYRKDKVDLKEESWSLLWDQNLQGRVAMLEDEQDAFGVGLFVEGYSLQSENPKELGNVVDTLINHAKEMKPRYLDLEDIKSQLMSGDIWASNCYSGDALLLADENENIECFIPDEGAPLWLDSFALVRDAPHPKNAHRFINFMSRGKVAAQNANYLWTATPNKEAEPFLDPEMTADTRVFLPEQMFSKCAFYALPTPERKRISNEGMKSVMDVIHPHVSAQNP